MNVNYIGILILLTYISVALAQSLHLFGILVCSKWRYFTGSVLSITAHGWFVYHLIDTPFGQNMNWLIVLSFTLWLMNVLCLITSFCHPRSKIENLSLFTYPLAAFSVIVVLSFASNNIINTKGQPGVLTHIFISLGAISLLALASFQAILMGLQNFLLKQHYPLSLVQILPPLQAMENLLFNILFCAWILLSGSLISGFFFHIGLLTPFLLPKTVMAFCAWILLLMLICGRILFGWRGLRAIRWTLSGTLLAFLSYFGTKALLL